MLAWPLRMQSVLNCARFRWASMQLQYLCSFKFDNDIKKSLGRLPPDLYTLYGDIYDFLSKTPGEQGAMVFKNVLSWLLCAQRRLRAEELLVAVSVNPSDKTSNNSITKEDVLELCNNSVVFDGQLNTFRFAHLSVREFLKTGLTSWTPTDWFQRSVFGPCYQKITKQQPEIYYVSLRSCAQCLY
jgi:hypothetical protein